MILIDGVARGFGDQMVLRDLSLRVEPGERLVLHGPNGAGKTTLLRCILGTLVPDAGSVVVGGHPAGSVAARALVGASLSQERSFYMRLTGFENLLLCARVRTTADELGQVTKRRADRCSTGQLQQLAFARALVGDPDAILLEGRLRDEAQEVLQLPGIAACGDGGGRGPLARGGRAHADRRGRRPAEHTGGGGRVRHAHAARLLLQSRRGQGSPRRGVSRARAHGAGVAARLPAATRPPP